MIKSGGIVLSKEMNKVALVVRISYPTQIQGWDKPS